MDLEDIDGIGPKTAEKLKDAGITDALQFMSHSPREISEITGVDSDTSAKWFRNVRKFYQEQNKAEKSSLTAREISEKRKNAKRVFLGCEPIDKALGGFETGSLYEVFGEFGSNKSQLGFTLMARAQLPEDQGGLDCEVAVIDTEHTFRPDRVLTIGQKYGLDDTLLDKIKVWTVRNTVEQKMALEEIEAEILAGKNYKLLVVDSAVGLYRSEYIGRGSLSDRQGAINKFITLLGHIANVYNLCVLATNQVQSDPGMQFGDPTKPIGGNVIGHASTYRIYLKKSGKNRIFRIIDSPNHPDTEIMFRVTEQGIMTVEDADKLDEERKKLSKKKKKDEEE